MAPRSAQRGENMSREPFRAVATLFKVPWKHVGAGEYIGSKDECQKSQNR